MKPCLRYLFPALAACLALGGCSSKTHYKYRIAVIPKGLTHEHRPTYNLVLLRYAVGSESTEQREKGFLDYLDEQRKKGKKIRLLSEDQYAGATVEEAQKVGARLLLKLQDERIDGIFAVNESSTTGLLNALKEQRMLGKVHVMGFD